MTEISAVLSVGFKPQAEAGWETVLECAFPVPESQGRWRLKLRTIFMNMN